MRSLVLAALAAFVMAGAALAGPTPQESTIEQLMDRLAGIKAKRAELDKQEAEAVGELRRKADALGKKLADLGVHPPVGPAPNPKPPPPKPNPADPLTALFQAAYDRDAGLDKKEGLADLAELYRQAVDLTKDSKVTTTAELVQRIQAAAKALKVTGLVEVRKLVAAEIAAVFPEDEPLTEARRSAAAVLFAKIHTALKGVS